MRRAIIVLTAVAVMVCLAGGIALAKNIKCPTKRGTHLCVGTNNPDTITGTNKMDKIRARGGDDQVTARGGNDKVSGGDGGDIIDGGPGNDTLNGGSNATGTLEGVGGGAGDDTLVESAGPDRYFFGADWGQDQITGDGDPLPGHDNDDVCFVCSGGLSPSVPLTINLSTGSATDGTNTVTWTAGIIEDATGGNGGDIITGSSVSNTVNGFAGADTIDVSNDPTGAADTVNCGGSPPNGDGVTDTVTKNSGDQTMNCESDNVTNAP
jgi:hypothetical protein